ncbi:Unknown protein sequence [Pseudomonas syringae pv. maculicola]|nr:Unknown protein sequence [Pseudomonas syringae pv. maculicola]
MTWQGILSQLKRYRVIGTTPGNLMKQFTLEAGRIWQG